MARRFYKDPTGLWKAVWGRRSGTPRYGPGRDRKGRFARVDLGPTAHWRFGPAPGRLSYHLGRDGRTYFRVRGRRVTVAEAQHEIALVARQMLEDLEIVGYTGDLEPPRELADEDDRVSWEANDADMSLEDIQESYGMAGAEKLFENDPDEVIEPDVQFSGMSMELLEMYWRKWEVPLRASPLGRWAMADKRIGIAIAYYAVAHKVVYEDRAAFGFVVRAPLVPLGREGFMVLQDRMMQVQERSSEPIDWRVGGFWMVWKVLT